jgi:putative transport protein
MSGASSSPTKTSRARSIASLNLQQKFNVLITRVQRGDMDLLATGDTVLELGDRILIVAHRSDLSGAL